MKAGIYEIKNNVNGKVYIGSTTNFTRRRQQHFRNLELGKHVNVKLQRAWVKYGSDAFTYSVIERVEDHSQLVIREQYWMEKTQSAKLGYNLAPNAGHTLGIKMSAEFRYSVSARMKGTKHSPETRQKISESNKGRHVDPSHLRLMVEKARSPEAIAKMIASKTGLKHSEKTKALMSEKQKGRKHTAETIAKMKGRVVSDATRAKQSAAATGKRHSQETIAKMKGRVFSEGTRLKMSLAKVGTAPSDEATNKANITRATNRLAKGILPKTSPSHIRKMELQRQRRASQK